MNDFLNRPQRAKELAMHRNETGAQAEQVEKMLANQCAREPTWNECPLEVKVERLREVLHRLEGVMDQTGKRAVEALAVAKVHEHGARGDVLTPAAPTYRDQLNELHFDLRHMFSRLR